MRPSSAAGRTTANLLAIGILAGSILIPGVARTCDSDRDCKGDRICDRGACRDLDGGSRRGDGRRSADLGAARARRGGSLRAMGAGWALLGLGSATAVGAIATAWGVGDVAKGLGAGSVVCFAVGAPIASIAGASARRGLGRLGAEGTRPGLRIPGWITYGFSVAGGAAAVVAGFAEGDTGVSVAGGSVALLSGIASIVLFEIDGSKNRRLLVEVIEDHQSSVRTPSARQFALLPYAMPASDAENATAGMVLVGTW